MSEPRVVDTPVLVVGGGPYGLATAACARRAGLDPLVVGEPMGFWRTGMPKGMLLRSGVDWHLDPDGIYTLAAYLEERGIDPDDVDPIPVELFIDYADWFAKQADVEPEADLVRELVRSNGGFEATLESGRQVRAGAVVAAVGIKRFSVIPEWVNGSLPPESWTHTVDLCRFDALRGSRCLIVGGRQSAFEWAALLGEQGAEEIHVVFRHDAPDFVHSDWTFVDSMIDSTLRVDGWFRRLPEVEQKAIAARFWAVGRLQLEPWLAPRIDKAFIHTRPRTSVTAVEERADGSVDVELSSGERLTVDHLILATGYAPDLENVPYLDGVVQDIDRADGFPVLDEHFQTSVPGLFIPGFPGTRDFGPFFGFVRGCPAAAELIRRDLVDAQPAPAS